MLPNIIIHTENIVSIWDKASEFLIKIFSIYQKKKVLLLLSGGSSVNLYKHLTYHLSLITYPNLAIGQVDERFQPGLAENIEHRTYNKEDTNAYQIEGTGLWKDCKKYKIPYYLISQEGTLEQAAEKYNRQLKYLFEHFSYKIGVLGIGEDGHTAGLIPGYKKSYDKEKLVVGYELETIKPKVVLVSPAKGGTHPGSHWDSGQARMTVMPKFRRRITFTPKALLQLDQAVVVAVGEKKMKVIKNITYSIEHRTEMKLDKYPAAILQKIKKVDLFTDVSI